LLFCKWGGIIGGLLFIARYRLKYNKLGARNGVGILDRYKNGVGVGYFIKKG
jgi:hypothetical protein